MIHIYTEATKETGLGHLSRCLSLYHAAQLRGLFPILFIWIDNVVKVNLNQYQHVAMRWQQEEDESLFSHSYISIVDSYTAGIKQLQIISLKSEKVLWFDDDLRLKYPSGYLLNAAFGAENLPYDSCEYHLLMGPKYICLRPSFWNSHKVIHNEFVNRIIIASGGTDILDFSVVCYQNVRIVYPNAHVSIITRSNWESLPKLRELARLDSQLALCYDLSADEMCDLFLNSDIALAGGGQTTLELVRLGVPTLALIVAENQRPNVVGLERNELILNAGFLEDIDIMQLRKLLTDLSSRSFRMEMAARASQVIDGQGAFRVLEAIL